MLICQCSRAKCFINDVTEQFSPSKAFLLASAHMSMAEKQSLIIVSLAFSTSDFLSNMQHSVNIVFCTQFRTFVAVQYIPFESVSATCSWSIALFLFLTATINVENVGDDRQILIAVPFSKRNFPKMYLLVASLLPSSPSYAEQALMHWYMSCSTNQFHSFESVMKCTAVASSPSHSLARAPAIKKFCSKQEMKSGRCTSITRKMCRLRPFQSVAEWI